jgi:hypothetical protein
MRPYIRFALTLMTIINGAYAAPSSGTDLAIHSPNIVIDRRDITGFTYHGCLNMHNLATPITASSLLLSWAWSTTPPSCTLTITNRDTTDEYYAYLNDESIPKNSVRLWSPEIAAGQSQSLVVHMIIGQPYSIYGVTNDDGE